VSYTVVTGRKATKRCWKHHFVLSTLSTYLAEERQIRVAVGISSCLVLREIIGQSKEVQLKSLNYCQLLLVFSWISSRQINSILAMGKDLSSYALKSLSNFVITISIIKLLSQYHQTVYSESLLNCLLLNPQSCMRLCTRSAYSVCQKVPTELLREIIGTVTRSKTLVNTSVIHSRYGKKGN
jgi:hypothetical protein